MKVSKRVFGGIVTGAKVNGWDVEIEISDYVPLKGASGALKKLKTPVGNGSCGFVVSVPAKYVFFTDKDGSFDACSATRLFDDPELGAITNKVVNVWAGIDEE
ncbi:hypothetical protein [Tahibacter amnicola]|uniref:Uncharacterized protein n=1 Tax=Tahibacter amnicola TaxID=2976241 RepID=A0ABY6BG58_9GAMM|nr:hypothetical protein [Tahibacter amnicola]UXI68060.1 hypothetical protein N4264_25595 [Tahibacter amnicola]